MTVEPSDQAVTVKYGLILVTVDHVRLDEFVTERTFDAWSGAQRHAALADAIEEATAAAGLNRSEIAQIDLRLIEVDGKPPPDPTPPENPP